MTTVNTPYKGYTIKAIQCIDRRSYIYTIYDLNYDSRYPVANSYRYKNKKYADFANATLAAKRDIDRVIKGTHKFVPTASTMRKVKEKV